MVVERVPRELLQALIEKGDIDSIVFVAAEWF